MYFRTSIFWKLSKEQNALTSSVKVKPIYRSANSTYGWVTHTFHFTINILAQIRYILSIICAFSNRRTKFLYWVVHVVHVGSISIHTCIKNILHELLLFGRMRPSISLFVAVFVLFLCLEDVVLSLIERLCISVQLLSHGTQTNKVVCTKSSVLKSFELFLRLLKFRSPPTSSL